QLERRADGPLLSAFPLADETCRYVQVTGKHRLTDALAFTQRAYFLGSQRPYRREAHLVEPPHSSLIHDPSVMEIGCRFMNCCQCIATVSLRLGRTFHRTLPR